MLIILSKNNDPYFNIASEEYFLKKFDQNIFYLYINLNSIIIGKHQNTLAEINYQFIQENNIPVVRRLSGGGTVFHDPGNINFCFISNEEKGELVNFKKYTTPIVNFLVSLNVNASHGGRNDILIEGSKISGNASHVFKSRVMHHGTLLYNSQLHSLTNALKNDPLKFKDKAVKSVRSKVTNILNHLEKQQSVEWFTKTLSEYIIKNYGCTLYEITEEDSIEIKKLVETKYKTWEWNFGYSPKYQLKKRIKSQSNYRFELILLVQKGEIIEATIKSNAKEQYKIKELERTLIGCLHQEDSLTNETMEIFNNWEELKQNELINALF